MRLLCFGGTRALTPLTIAMLGRAEDRRCSN